MKKVVCRYQSKLDLIESLINYIENSKEELTIDDILNKLYRSSMFYRNSLAQLD